MTRTNTHTKTETFTRSICIRNQFKMAFKRIMAYSDAECKKYLDVIKLQKIDKVTFWGYKFNSYGEKEKWVELILSVDWNKHNNYIMRGLDQVQLKKKWNEIIPDCDIAVYTIEECIEEYNLTPNFSIRFSQDLTDMEKEKYSNELGLVSSKTIPWKKNTVVNENCADEVIVKKYNPKELDEMNVELLFTP